MVAIALVHVVFQFKDAKYGCNRASLQDNNIFVICSKFWHSIPDSLGNNRRGSLESIPSAGRVGHFFLIPGFDETLRLDGEARLSTEPADIAAHHRAPTVVIRVAVSAAFLLCARTSLRSKLWSELALEAITALPLHRQCAAFCDAQKYPPI